MKMARLRTWKGLSILVALALVLALGAVAVALVGTAEAVVLPAEVWVDDSGPSCPDTGNGTQAYPYCKIQTGIDNVAPGGTVHVRAGNYTENLFINKSLTLQSTDGWQNTTIDPAVLSIIRIEGDVDVTVQGFEITEGSSYGIYIGEVFSTVNILDCFIHDNAADGIHVAQGGDLLHIEGNIISQNGATAGGCGINITQAWSTTNILHNIIGAWWDGEYVGTTYFGNNGTGIDIDSVPFGTDVIIDGNHIVANGGNATDYHGINFDSVAGDVDIQDNVIGAWTYYYGGGVAIGFGGNKNHGIHVAHVTDTGTITIEGNAISENNEDGINFGQGVDAIFGNVDIKGNLIGGWTCYPGDYGYSGNPQRYTGNYGEGIYIFQVRDSGTVTIDDNKISENGYDTGIYINEMGGVVTIADNDIGAWEDRYRELYLGNAGDGLYVYLVWPGAELTIGPHNSIKENTNNGIEICNAQPTGAATVTVHHNTIDNNGWNGIQLGMPYEFDGDMIDHDTVGNNGLNGMDQLFTLCEVDGATINHNTVNNNTVGIYLAGPSDQNIISDNEIRDNIDGIVIEGNDNQILRNNILNNNGAVPSGIHLTSTAHGNVIHCNNIVGNDPYGVSYGGGMTFVDSPSLGLYNQDGDEAVDATGNWWGCIEGPGAAGCDLVLGNVIYDPWLLDEFQNCPECVGTPPPPGVPTVNHWGIAAMISLFAGLLVWRVRRRRLAS
jgi:parallel beta-helix repeat protein